MSVDNGEKLRASSRIPQRRVFLSLLLLSACVVHLSRKTRTSVVQQVDPPRASSNVFTASRALSVTTTPQQQKKKISLKECAKQRPINVLSLGGSVTWGAALESRELAFPYLLAPNVTNLAIRATGSQYPSVCIQTMLQEVGAANVEYDLITLEFALNGLECVSPLLHRLRRRYPKAVIMSVDLWSFMTAVKETKSGERPVWLLQRKDKIVPPQDLEENTLTLDQVVESRKAHTEQAIRAVDGVAFRLPAPDPKIVLDHEWFSDDYHHLGPRGHRVVANGILRTYCQKLAQQLAIATLSVHRLSPKYDGTWGKGDHCISWFEGNNDSAMNQHVHVGGGQYVEFAPTKFAHEVKSGETLSLRLKTRFEEPYKVAIVHMAKGMPSIYPKSMVTFVGNAHGRELKMELNPLNSKGKYVHHVSRIQVIGALQPKQENTITFQPIETTQEPLRVTALMVCPECADLTADDNFCPLFRPLPNRVGAAKVLNLEQ